MSLFSTTLILPFVWIRPPFSWRGWTWQRFGCQDEGCRGLEEALLKPQAGGWQGYPATNIAIQESA